MEGGVKGNKRFYEMEDKGVHCKRYDGHCTEQQIKIPKAT
jgi:hypothetical protein